MMNRSQTTVLVVVGSICIVGLVIGLLARPAAPPAPQALDIVRNAARSKKTDPKAAEARLAAVIASLDQKTDAESQDAAAKARMELGYIHAGNGDPAKAREVFLEADERYQGSGAMSPEYGRLDDQARYQAIAALNAAGRKDEYKKELIAFLKDRPLSPLVSGAYARLCKIDPENRDEYDGLIQAAEDKQTKHAQMEMAMCGPRALKWVADYYKVSAGMDDLKKLCKTDETGTTMENLLAAAQKLGLNVEGFELNRADFAAVPTPSIWLRDTHYVVLLAVRAKSVLVYDPMLLAEHEYPLAPSEDDQFKATVLKVTRP